MPPPRQIPSLSAHGYHPGVQTFVSRGNVVDLAVGVIMGAAFGKIVSSLVGDILMPPLELILGVFLQNTFDFLVVTFCIFLLVQAINKLKRKEAEVPPDAKTLPTAEEQLLMEIRDILKSRDAHPQS